MLVLRISYVLHIIITGILIEENQMATSSFAKTIVVNTDKAAETIIKAVESSRNTPPAVSSTSCKVATKETLAKKSRLR